MTLCQLNAGWHQNFTTTHLIALQANGGQVFEARSSWLGVCSRDVEQGPQHVSKPDRSREEGRAGNRALDPWTPAAGACGASTLLGDTSSVLGWGIPLQGRARIDASAGIQTSFVVNLAVLNTLNPFSWGEEESAGYDRGRTWCRREVHVGDVAGHLVWSTTR